jgi:hypothetical protein
VRIARNDDFVHRDHGKRIFYSEPKAYALITRSAIDVNESFFNTSAWSRSVFETRMRPSATTPVRQKRKATRREASCSSAAREL